MNLQNDQQFVELLLEQGILRGTLLVLCLIVIQQAWKHKEELTNTWINFVGRMAELLADYIRVHNDRFIQDVSQQVAEVYTHLYLLIRIQPVRALVLKFVRRQEEGREFYEVWVMHEAVLGIPPVKQYLQGIRTGLQMQVEIQHLVTDPMGEHYIEDVEELENGEYKDMLLSDDIRSAMNIMLDYNSRRVWMLAVHFNRTEALEPPEMAVIRLCAANISKLIIPKKYARK